MAWYIMYRYRYRPPCATWLQYRTGKLRPVGIHPSSAYPKGRERVTVCPQTQNIVGIKRCSQFAFNDDALDALDLADSKASMGTCC